MSLGLSTSGKLRWLEAVPPKTAPRSPTDPEQKTCDWQPLFTAAGLSLADFEPTEPRRTPTQGCDERAAWVGPHPEKPEVEVTVEAAAFRGRPVTFEFLESPWTDTPWFAEPRPADLAQFWLRLAALIGGIELARRNLWNGRGDRRAAARLALLVLLVGFAGSLLRANHTTHLLLEKETVVQGLSLALYYGGLVWLLYLALEPHVRRFWPDHMVSWSRLLTGRWRDPLVARDCLIGLGAGMLGTLMGMAQVGLGLWLDAPEAVPVTTNFPDADGLAGMIARLCSKAIDGVQVSFILFFALVALRFLVRRSWIAYVLFAPLVLLANPFAHTVGLWTVDWTGRLLLGALLLFVVGRFGFFALAVAMATFILLNDVPLTTDLSAWYGSQTLFAALVLGGLTLAGARLASGGLRAHSA